jgi:long-chain-fatty-acid---luciferin-component ligase
MTSSATRVNAMSLIEDVVFQREDAFEIAGAELADLQTQLFRDALDHHLKSCPAYARYCSANGWDISAFQSIQDIGSVPLIPSALFKRGGLLSCAEDEVVKICTSSGTQGTKSVVYRDGRTLERFLGTVQQGVDLAFPEPETDRPLLVLGPDTDEAADLWFSYVLSIVDLIYPTTFYVRDGVLRLDEALEAIMDRTMAFPVLIGPPVLIRDVLRTMGDRGLRADWGRSEGMVITAGGWKSFEGDSMPRQEFEDLAVDRLSLAGGQQVRDCYNAVELNSVLFECAHRAKHVPAWLHVTARDPATHAPLPDGVLGVLAFCDATPTSYPGFVVTDDVGRVSGEGSCECGLPSRTVTIDRRVASVEARGCALKMDREVRR